MSAPSCPTSSSPWSYLPAVACVMLTEIEPGLSPAASVSDGSVTGGAVVPGCGAATGVVCGPSWYPGALAATRSPPSFSTGAALTRGTAGRLAWDGPESMGPVGDPSAVVRA